MEKVSEVVTLKQLEYFVAVAEELHFGRAATRVGIAQPPLSQQIRRLEDHMGTTLLIRDRRSVRLTDTGSTLLDGAREVLASATRMLDGVRRAEAGVAGAIRLGFVGSAAHEVLPTLLRRFRERYPDARIVPSEGSTTEQAEAIGAGLLDAGIVRMPIASTEVMTRPLLEEPLVIAVPDFHPLAGQRRVPLAALADEDFVLWGRRLNPLFHDEVISACHDAGFVPNVVQEAGEMPTIVSLVAAGLGVSLVPASMDRVRRDGVAYLEVDGPAVQIALALAWRRQTPSALVRNLVAVARETWPRRNRRS